MTFNISTSKRDTVSTETYTFTTHTVRVDVADLLGQFDVHDEVILAIATPSGRDKRVRISGNFLVASIERYN